MIPDPLQRRFGHGAARLVIGRPSAGPSLGALARTPSPHEARFAALPALLCALLAGFLTTTTRVVPPTPASEPVARPAPTTLEIALWSEPAAVPIVAPAPPEAAPPARPDEPARRSTDEEIEGVFDRMLATITADATADDTEEQVTTKMMQKFLISIMKSIP